jgi:hypothetical protein
MSSSRYDPVTGSNFGTLCFEGEYVIQFGHEDVFLAWDGGAIQIGRHYGNANAAVMDVAEGWCVTGGSGLTIVIFEYGFPKAGAPIEDFPFRSLNLWDRANPPPDGRDCWFVEGLWFRLSERDADGRVARVLVHALIEPGLPNAGLYEIELLSLTWRRI